MFKKGPDIDKKKLLQKASDVKKDSSTRLKHFKTLIEHLDFNELPMLFKTHFSFIYHTFIDTFSTFDCNSKQRRDDLECILFMLEKILTYNPDLIKKRWQFFSITFVMQRLLHQNNTWQLRQEGVRLFIIWYQILCDEVNAELQIMFASLVPGIVPPSCLPSPSPTTATSPTSIVQQQQAINQQQYSIQQHNSTASQLPGKFLSIEPLVPMSAIEQAPTDETSFYLDSLLQYMVTQITKPFWSSPDEARKNQELGFSFTFNMFKTLYLQHLFPNLNLHLNSRTKSYFTYNPVSQYVDSESSDTTCQYLGQNTVDHHAGTAPASMNSPRRDLLLLDLKQSGFMSPASPVSQSSMEQERTISLSSYQAIVIKWLTRILRQDMIPGQDELIRAGGSAERGDGKENHNDPEYSFAADGNSATIFQGVETASREMEIARRVTGTWPENIAIVHELFRRAFLTFHQPASMKRVVNVYREWICHGGPNQTNSAYSRTPRLGYTSFSDLLQVFVLNSSNAFVTKVQSQTMLDEQVDMCKRIMNIYRYMVMKIYMNTSTWERLLNVMLAITEHLFPIVPPEKKENTIGGRIAPAFFQTFIVSWIRANLYVHISNQMWNEFHRVMKNLICWRELVEEWSTTMGSLTRVLVKHVYGLSLTDLPLDKPQERRRRAKALKSFSTAESATIKASEQINSRESGSTTTASGIVGSSIMEHNENAPRTNRSGSVRLPNSSFKDISRGLIRSNSDGIICTAAKIYHSSLKSETGTVLANRKMRKIKSEYLLLEANISAASGRRSSSPANTDVLDGVSLKDPNMTIEHDDSGKLSSSEMSKAHNKRQQDSKLNSDKCVLLGGSVRGWTNENSVIMWRRMLGLFGNINHIADPANHLVAIKCLSSILTDFMKTRENLGVSLDNQSTPEQPNLIPPHTYPIAWLLEATHLPRQYNEARLLAYKLLCQMIIRRHDVELSHQYYTAFYDAIQRGLTSSEVGIHASIIRNATHLLSHELPGCTFLVQGLYERCRSILLSNQPQGTSAPRDESIQILNSILTLYRPIKKLTVLRLESNSSLNLAAPSDLKSKIFDTFLTCQLHPVVFFAGQTKSRSMGSMAVHVYHELSERGDCPEVEKLFDILLTELQNSNDYQLFRMDCDTLRLFSEHAGSLVQTRPALVSSLIQILCQLIVRLSTSESNKEPIHFLLICLEDWCLAVGKTFLMKPVGQLSAENDDTLSRSLNESLITIILRSLENVIHDEQYIDEASNRGTHSTFDASSVSHHSQGKNSNSDYGFSRDRTITNKENRQGSNNTSTTATDSPTTATTTSANNNIGSVATGSGSRGGRSFGKNLSAIKLGCKILHYKLVTYLGHFPLRQVGAASMSCCVSEADYLSGGEQELTDIKSSSGVFLLVVDQTTIISFIGSTKTNCNNGCHQSPPATSHLVIRNLCGKYSWDVSCIECPDTLQGGKGQPAADQDKNYVVIDSDSFQETSRTSMKYDSDFNEDGNSTSSLSSRSSSNRDCINDLLNHLSMSFASANGSSISSNSQNLQRKRNCAQSACNSRFKIAQAEETMIALLTNQRFQELNHCEKSDDMDRVVLNFAANCKLKDDVNAKIQASQQQPTQQRQPFISFEQCRQLIQQLGYLSWDKRCKIDSLAKSPRLLRELKNLDSQSSRETHKIAVIYVACGQEDKNSILLNTHGSRAFEDFVTGLGWEVNLASHLGFKGGLQTNKSTGETSPYYCNGTTEVMFHVSTRLPINGPADDESLNRKLRHLGNDEVHIVWSEHAREYRRGIIPTEFGDVIIVIYPMLTFQSYFRIQVITKQDVPLFGPLFDNCIVHQTSLAPLVRATAINASRAKRLKLPYYQSHFEERSRLIETIVQHHKEKLSFEEFAVQLYNDAEQLSASPSGSIDSEAIRQSATACN